MPIAILCSNCHAPYTVPDRLAGKTVTCKRCNAILDVPSPFARRPAVAASSATAYERVLGRPNPVFLEIIGLRTRFDEPMGGKEIARLIFGLRHLVLLIVLLVLWSHYASTVVLAQLAAPIFFAAGLALILLSWVQISLTSRSIAQSIGSRNSPSFLPQILSSFMLIITDWRSSMAALRTFFLGTLTLIAAMSLASEAGGLSYVLPINSLPSFTTAPPKHPEKSSDEEAPIPTVPETKPTPPAPPPTLPPPPPTDEKPIPPPDESAPIPPPPP